MKKAFLTGNQIVVQACLAAQGEIMFGYPITPSTEILEEWSRLANRKSQIADHKEKEQPAISDKRLAILQTEDEMSAGFSMIGGVLAGKKCFTATSGPGNILMQDAFSMAEAMRLPTVAIIVQRGGPSTGTVIYSQNETTLTCFGGNTEGFRIVYAPSSLQELYNLVIKAFNSAWKYRFPAFVLSDGYQGKMKGLVRLNKPKKNEINKPKPIFLKSKYTNLRNCYDLEEELFQANTQTKKAFEKARKEIEEFEEINCQRAEIIIFAYGTVANAIKAVLKNSKSKIGLFRPITLSPFPKKKIRQIFKKTTCKKVLIIESAINQLGRLVKDALAGIEIEIREDYRSGLGITPEEVEKIIN